MSARVVLAVGTRMPVWVDAGVTEYVRRMPGDWAIDVREIKPEPRGKSRSRETVMALEAERIRAALPRRARTVVLDEHGIAVTSAELAARLGTWHDADESVAFIIGGADGVAADLKAEAGLILRLSSMTLPHGLCRLLLVEQLYRAWSILHGHPYHRS